MRARQAPPFVTYRVSTHVSAPSLHRERDVIRGVSVRTRDDVAVIQDLPRGRNQVGHGFPVTPAFDALSYFVFSWAVRSRLDVSAYVHDVQPLTYVPKPSGADVVVISLRQYKAQYASDSSEDPQGRTHLVLTPFQFVRDQSNPHETFFFNDLYIENATGLPSRVRFLGPEDKEFVVDYAHVDGNWVVNHIHYEETLHPVPLLRFHVIGDAVYDQFAFPSAPPDPRLAG